MTVVNSLGVGGRRAAGGAQAAGMASGLKLYIDTERVIAAVRAQPTIWDVMHADYKSRAARGQAWRQVCESVVDYFAGFAKDDRRELEKRVQQRWRTARDCFVKGRMRGPANTDTPYAYMDLLGFLEPAVRHPQRLPPAAPAPAAPAAADGDGEGQHASEPELLVPRRMVYKRRAKRKRMLHTRGPPVMSKRPRRAKAAADLGPGQEDEEEAPPGAPDERAAAAAAAAAERAAMTAFERQLLAALRHKESPLAEDDENFFRSLAPLLRAWTAHHKLVFRARVLSIAMDVQAQSGAVFSEAMPPELEAGGSAPLDEPPERKYHPYDRDDAASNTESD